MNQPQLYRPGEPVTNQPTPTPYSPALEKAVVPGVEDIERAILTLLEE